MLIFFAVPASEVEHSSTSTSTSSSISPTTTHNTISPSTVRLDQVGSPPVDGYIFGMAPADPTVLVSCKVCDRVILQTAFAKHYAAEGSSQSVPSKKRKRPVAEKDTSDSLASKPKKAAADEPVTRPNKVARTKKTSEPIDLDKQCGVRRDTGVLCTRSITCKIHSVGAKRSVAGRSQLYDLLFQEHRQNYLGKAGVGRKSPLPGRASLIPPPLTIPTPNAEKPMSKEEEADLVFEAIRAHRPQPIIGPQSDFSALRMLRAFQGRQALVNALRGRPV
ncbi:SCA7, zinc-binding domain-containing protein [Phlyctochytrium arcticum]|nr:SCA7, zinc-binding domain-containing protein [Phlyctochytrium arcticum]